MTIAACYVSSEGIVLGADSTSTLMVPMPNGTCGPPHHLNFAQKIFELGENATMGVAIWGLGAFRESSHRTLIAEIGDALLASPVNSMSEAANCFSQRLWQAYQQSFDVLLTQYQTISAVPESQRDQQQKNTLVALRQNLSGGFCLGGRVPDKRRPSAFEILFGPHLTQPPSPTELPLGRASFWGCPNFIERILYGFDPDIFDEILASGKWSGTPQELAQIVLQQQLSQPADLPLREAIDWVNTVIYTTIKAMKFSHHLPVCGGPIEIAVISSDRPFRWVRHKSLQAALE